MRPQHLEVLRDDTDQAGSSEADLKVQSERKAMQELHRFQKLSMQTLAVSGTAEPPEPTSSAEADAAVPDQPLCQLAIRMAPGTNQRLDATYQCAFASHTV